MLKKINFFLLDILFPVRCLICEKDGAWICDPCLGKIAPLESQVCPYCEKQAAFGGQICHNCREKFLNKNQLIPLDRLIVAARYGESHLARLVHLFKYRFVSDLHIPLGKIVAKSLAQNDLPVPDLIVPVPLHSRRLRWRGFNQSELLANFIAQNLTPGFPVPVISDLIYRKKYATPQMKIKKYQQRKENVKNAFYLNSNIDYNIYDIRDRSILLIDDIATTGATLFECGRILKNHGARKVFGAVIARQEIATRQKR